MRCDASEQGPVTRSQIRVLLAEDNPTDALLLKESLGDVAGVVFAMRHVECLVDCLEILSQETFDAVLIDLGLPDSTGLETFRRIREAAPEAVILVLTGLEDEDTGVKAVQMGAEDYLMKSQVRTSLLGRIVRYAIERHELKKRLEETREREARDREVQSVEQLSTAPSTPVTASIYAGSSLRENAPETFNDLVREYARLLEVSLELRTYKTGRTLSDELRDLGNEFGMLRASPRDVVEIHATVLKEKLRGLNSQKAQALLEEGRVAVLELMGYVAGFYRSFYTLPARRGQRE